MSEVTPKADHCPKCGAEADDWSGYDWGDGGVSNTFTCDECGAEVRQWENLVPTAQFVREDNGTETEFDLEGPSPTIRLIAVLSEMLTEMKTAGVLNVYEVHPSEFGLRPQTPLGAAVLRARALLDEFKS